MRDRLIKLLQFRIRDLLILIALLGGIGGWLLMYYQERERELMTINQVLGERAMPSQNTLYDGWFGVETRFEDNQILDWRSRRATIYLDYSGPEFLRYHVEHYFPEQATIFHRVIKFEFNGLAASKKNLQPLDQLKSLKVIKFSRRTFENVDSISSVMPGWKPRTIDQQNRHFQGNWYGGIHLHPESSGN